jgi:hypothetical protein
MALVHDIWPYLVDLRARTRIRPDWSPQAPGGPGSCDQAPACTGEAQTEGLPGQVERI